MTTVAASRLANPFVGDVPTRVESRLQVEDVEFTTIAFNPRGTYLAAGSAQGDLVIWDLVTLSPALRIVKLHQAEVTSVSWVRKGKGRLLCTTSSDGWVKVVNLESRTLISCLQFEEEVIGAATHPEDPSQCLVCLSAKDGSDQVPWPGLYATRKKTDRSVPPPQPKVRYVIQSLGENAPKCFGVASTFSKRGKLVFVGGVSSGIHSFSTATGDQLSVVFPENPRGGPGPKGWVHALTLSRNGRVLLSDAGGRYISMFDVASDSMLEKHDVLPADASLEAVQDAMRWRTKRLVVFKKNLLDVVNPTKWSDMCCSGHAEFVLGTSSAKDAHELFVWDVTGQLVHMLKDPLGGFGVVRRSIWHPWRPQIATVTGDGVICLWGNTSIVEDKSWLAFAPGFVEIEENIVYQEPPESGDGGASTPPPPPVPSVPPTPGKSSLDVIEDAASFQTSPVNVVDPDTFVEMFSDDEDSDLDEPSARAAPRSLTRGIGYFLRAEARPTQISGVSL